MKQAASENGPYGAPTVVFVCRERMNPGAATVMMAVSNTDGARSIDDGRSLGEFEKDRKAREIADRNVNHWRLLPILNILNR